MGPRGPSAVKMAVRAGLDHVLEAQQSLARAAGAGAAHGVEAEELEDAGDQLAVKALADENDGAGAAEVDRAGQHALMPEAEDLRAGDFTPEGTGATPSSAITSKRQVRPQMLKSVQTTREPRPARVAGGE